MGVGNVGLGKFNIFRLYMAVSRPFFSRREYQWLTIKNRPITVLAKDDILREGDIAQCDPGIAHIAHSFRNSAGNFSIILYATLRNQFAARPKLLLMLDDEAWILHHPPVIVPMIPIPKRRRVSRH